MTQITASMVKELREQSGAGMMDAKKALQEVDGDMEKAIDYLRTKGVAKAEKKSSRTAAEGLVAIVTNGTTGSVVEVNSETDFVARNAEFQEFVTNVAKKSLDINNIQELLDVDYEGKPVKDVLTSKIATIGEHMGIRRAEKVSVSDGVVSGYVHNAVAPNLGKIGVLVGLESTGDKGALEALGKQIAMHVAAAFPQCLDAASADQAALERERNIIRETALAEGKPADIVEKMLDGRMKKYLKDICLMDQIFVIDGETSIADLVKNAEKDAGAPVALTSYARVQLGEGIEKEVEDFAAEVNKVANG